VSTFVQINSLLADYGTEMVLKRLTGKTEVEDAFGQLDTLTKEENLMTAARTLEVAHHVNDSVTVIKDIVHGVDGNVLATKELTHEIHKDTTVAKKLTHDVHKDVSAIKEDTRGVGHNVKVIKRGAKLFLIRFILIPTFVICQIAIDAQQRSSYPYLPFLIVIAEAHSQGTSCEKTFEHGSLPRVLLSITILRAKSNITELQNGLSEVTHSTGGRRMGHCCGSVAIVRFSLFVILYD